MKDAREGVLSRKAQENEGGYFQENRNIRELIQQKTEFKLFRQFLEVPFILTLNHHTLQTYHELSASAF